MTGIVYVRLRISRRSFSAAPSPTWSGHREMTEKTDIFDMLYYL
jgi:hypothetical protein